MEQATLPGARENHATVIDAVDGGLWRLGNDELLALARTSMMTQAQSQAAHLSVVAEIEARGVAASVGALDTKNLLRTKLNITPSLAAEQARLAAAFAAGAADTGQALAEGRIHYEQATTIVRILGALPTKATVEDHAFAQKVLLEAAEKVDAKRLRKLKRSLHDGIDPDGPEPTETRKACTAHVRDNGDGTETLTWTDTVDAMGMLRAVIERHYAPVQGEPDETPCTPGQRRAAALREAHRARPAHRATPQTPRAAPAPQRQGCPPVGRPEIPHRHPRPVDRTRRPRRGLRVPTVRPTTRPLRSAPSDPLVTGPRTYRPRQPCVVLFWSPRRRPRTRVARPHGTRRAPRSDPPTMGRPAAKTTPQRVLAHPTPTHPRHRLAPTLRPVIRQ